MGLLSKKSIKITEGGKEDIWISVADLFEMASHLDRINKGLNFSQGAVKESNRLEDDTNND